MTPELYRSWRAPRFGRSNPEFMNNPVWESLIRSGASAYQAAKQFGGPSPFDAGPAWCFQRFGQSRTSLPDGRTVLIAGEHEDHYDPDFYIYNDVVVLKPDGSLDIYGYPERVFPPTDFHSATLLGDEIVLVGSLGYSRLRRPGKTQVLALRLADFSITRKRTTGTPPGWIHEHEATLADDGRSLLISGGRLAVRDDDLPVENIDDWRLWLGEWRWERLTDRRWPRWRCRRVDGARNRLWDMRLAVCEKSRPYRLTRSHLRELLLKNDPDLDAEALEHILESNDSPADSPDFDAEVLAKLYRPAVKHVELPERDGEYNVHRIEIAGVTVRYVEDSWAVEVTVEGRLPEETIEMLQTDLLEKLERLANTAWAIREI